MQIFNIIKDSIKNINNFKYSYLRYYSIEEDRKVFLKKTLFKKNYTLYICRLDYLLKKLIIKGPRIKAKFYNDEYIVNYIIYNLSDDTIEYHLVTKRNYIEKIYNINSILVPEMLADVLTVQILEGHLSYIEWALKNGKYKNYIIYDKITSRKKILEVIPIDEEITNNIRLDRLNVQLLELEPGYDEEIDPYNI